MDIRTVRLARSGGVALVVLTGLAWAPSAHAADGPAAGAQCVVDSASGQQRCFDSFTEAVDWATKGRIKDAPADARQAAHDKGFRAEAADGARTLGARDAEAQDGVIQGTFFDETGYGGASLTISGPELCKKDGWINWQYDLGDDWKNRISSVQPWGNCAIWLYPEPNLGGDRDGPFDENAPDIGSIMNDRTQSIGFS